MICRSKKLHLSRIEAGLVLAVVFSAWWVFANSSATDGSVATRLFVGQNGNGQLEVFEVGPDGDLCHRWRKSSNGAWSGWSTLGGSLLPGLAILTNADGQMEVFALDRTSHALECIHQLTTNSLTWSAWTNLGGAFASPPVAGRNPDGRLEVFAVDAATHEVRHRWQISPHGPWSDWSDLGGSLKPGLVISRNRDGRLELFGLAAEDSPQIGLTGWNIVPGSLQ